MLDQRDAFNLLFGSEAKTDGSFLGKDRVQQRPVTCKDGTVKHVAWLSKTQDLKLPGWSRCRVGLDTTEVGPQMIVKPAAKAKDMEQSQE